MIATGVPPPSITAAEQMADSLPVLRIEPSSGWISLQLGELWHYRELLLFLAWRDVKVRYKQTFLGVTWAILVPVFTAAVYVIVFGKFAKFPSGLTLVGAYAMAAQRHMHQFGTTAEQLASISVQIREHAGRMAALEACA